MRIGLLEDVDEPVEVAAKRTPGGFAILEDGELVIRTNEHDAGEYVWIVARAMRDIPDVRVFAYVEETRDAPFGVLLERVLEKMRCVDIVSKCLYSLYITHINTDTDVRTCSVQVSSPENDAFLSEVRVRVDDVCDRVRLSVDVLAWKKSPLPPEIWHRVWKATFG